MKPSDWDKLVIGSKIQLGEYPQPHVVVLKDESIFLAVAAISLTDGDGWDCLHQHGGSDLRYVRVGDQLKRKISGSWIEYIVTHVYIGNVLAMSAQVIRRADESFLQFISIVE